MSKPRRTTRTAVLRLLHALVLVAEVAAGWFDGYRPTACEADRPR